MAKRIDEVRRGEWEERLGRFSEADTTVGAFCRLEQVSEASFYYWRKKIYGPSRKRLGKVAEKVGTFRPVEVMQATPALEVQFDHGAKLLVRGNQTDVVRAVVAELVRSDSPC